MSNVGTRPSHGDGDAPEHAPLPRQPRPCPDCLGHLEPSTVAMPGSFAHDEGCPAGAAMDAVSATDREWFAAHPGTSEYWRRLMPGDLGLHSLSCVGSIDGRPLRVRVRQIADGVRGRTIPANMYIRTGTPDGDRLAYRLGLSAAP